MAVIKCHNRGGGQVSLITDLTSTKQQIMGGVCRLELPTIGYVTISHCA